jgi:hypothetical protein
MTSKPDAQTTSTEAETVRPTKNEGLSVPVDFARAVNALMVEAEVRANADSTPLPGRRVRFVLR